MNRHAFGNTTDVIDLGSAHYMRPIHRLTLPGVLDGTPIMPRPDSPVEGFMLWHDCALESDNCWRSVFPGGALKCPICGDNGQIANGEWVAA